MTSASKGSAIITGGAGGIGCEIARRLKADGFRVVITDIGVTGIFLDVSGGFE
jgi:NAD(P)-dependent dehydrogenase (short-subunit alcohol dehydrogenase family)